MCAAPATVDPPAESHASSRGATSALARFRFGLRRLGSAFKRAGPRRLFGAVDGPAAADAGLVIVSGWTYDPRLATLGVVVTLDGRPCAVAPGGSERPDIAALRPQHPAALHSGWSAVVDLSRHAGEVARIGGYAVRSNGVCEPLRELDLEVAHSHHVGGVLHTQVTSCGELLAISGALDSPTPPARVEVRLDGEVVGLARPFCDLPAPGVGAHGPVGGFQFLADVLSASPTPRVVQVEIVAELLDGSRCRLGPSFVAADRPRPVQDPELERVRSLTARVVRAPAHREGPRVRLLVVTHSLTLGGGQLYLDSLLHGLLDHGDTSCVVVSAFDGPLRGPLESRGATVVVTGPYSVLDPHAYELQVLEIVAAARWHDANVALVNTIGVSVGADAARRLGIPYVWAIHESCTPREAWALCFGPRGYDPEVRRLGLEALRDAARIVFEANATLDLFADHVEKSHLVVVPYGVDFSEIDRFRAGVERDHLRRQHGFTPGDVVVVAVGTMEPRKAQAALVLAFTELADRFPDAKLVLVGDSPSPYSAALRELISRLDVGERVELVPVTTNIYHWYEVADLIVSASDFESMPRSFIEAMAFRRTILSTDVFGVPELITDGETGLLMPARDLPAMVRGLERALSLTPDEREAIGHAASDWVRRHHDAAGYIRSYRDLLDELAAGPGG